MELRNNPDVDPGGISAEIEIANFKQTSNENKRMQSDVIIGICTTCDFLNACVWQHNNKIFCEHFQ